MVVLTDYAARVMLRSVLGKSLALRLYSNDVRPGKADTVKNYTEATFSGYAPAVLSGERWVWNGNTAKYPIQEFVASGKKGELVYGYYITFADSNALLWAERFEDGPVAMNILGDTIGVTLKV